ncbi:hypothetical protein STEG23_027676 [Scotinomys teguina]
MSELRPGECLEILPRLLCIPARFSELKDLTGPPEGVSGIQVLLSSPAPATLRRYLQTGFPLLSLEALTCPDTELWFIRAPCRLGPTVPIPTSLPPQIPAGLRPRFSAFGGSPPVTGPGSIVALRSPTSGKRKKKRKVTEASAIPETANGHGAVEVDTAWGGSEMGMRKKKMKYRVGEAEMMEAEATEPVAEMAEPLGLPFPSATSSKKRSKSKGAETVQPEEDLGHTEPVAEMQPADGTILSPTKKRRRQKEAEGTEAAEHTVADSQPQVTVDPRAEAISLSPTKKRRKEKRQDLVMEPGMGLPGVIIEPECSEQGLQAEAAPVSPKKTKKKKKEKWRGEAPVLGTEVTEAALLADFEPQVAPAPSKEEEKGGTALEPLSEMTDPRESIGPEAGAAPRSTKKKKKKKDQESSV